MNVNLERLKSMLFALAEFGYNHEDKGIYRQGFSDEDFAARKWLMSCAQQEGFISRMDGAGNVIIEMTSPEIATKPAVIIGSH
ncbi:hypothetical protein [Pseudoalteromonas peptidolytica]|uniref:Allantoate amidohydrolase n=1 Tax=Pseudoalteromonas peptidolytica F12-50-A1 TaxID=1315280 RepID=A0A8I0T1N7_9GAMM|nr:hypothetical protein [Pseudoalteromonas peptidolytica]MBE0344731.1 hypothetical protein [Pseudoalteromonas peptidolytica F12-50-A1]GEK08147.1 hypothetical protein PPE03_03960 [Pseudoalteromonas peptidolytica]